MTIEVQESVGKRVVKVLFLAAQVVVGPFVYYTAFFTIPMALGFTGMTIPKIDLWNDFSVHNLFQVLTFVGYSLLFASRGLIAVTPVLIAIWIFSVRAATFRHSGWIVASIGYWLAWLLLGVGIWVCILVRKFGGATWMISGM